MNLFVDDLLWIILSFWLRILPPVSLPLWSAFDLFAFLRGYLADLRWFRDFWLLDGLWLVVVSKKLKIIDLRDHLRR